VINRLWLAFGAFVVVAVGVIAFVSLGHGVSGTPAQRLRSWVTSTSLGQDVGTLVGDGGDVRKALAAGKDVDAIHTVCAAMATSAQTYNDDLPSPDTAVTQLLARAYGLEYDAAESCYRAPTTSAATRLLAASARDRREAASVFDEVLHRVRSVTGSTVSTTTTTVPDLTGTGIL
jgi:hypothetical protein